MRTTYPMDLYFSLYFFTVITETVTTRLTSLPPSKWLLYRIQYTCFCIHASQFALFVPLCQKPLMCLCHWAYRSKHNKSTILLTVALLKLPKLQERHGLKIASDFVQPLCAWEFTRPIGLAQKNIWNKIQLDHIISEPGNIASRGLLFLNINWSHSPMASVWPRPALSVMM